MSGVMMRRAGIRSQPTGSVSLRPGTPFTRHGGFAHIGGREELIGLPGRYAVPSGNVSARHIAGESAWKRAALADIEPTTYVSLGQHSAYRNGYTILARIKVSVYASIESVIWSSYYDSTAANFDANGLAVGMNVVENIQCFNYNGADRFASTGVSTVMRGQWHNVVFVCGRTTDALTTEGTWYREIWVNGRLRVTVRHPTITQTWGMSEIGILGSRYAEDPVGVDRNFPELSLFAVSFENLRQQDAAEASLDPYGYLFGDRRIWVPVSVAGGGTYTDSITDSAAGTDAASSSLFALHSLSDSAAATDTVTGSTAATEPTTDSASGTDTASALLTVTQVIADAAAATDTTTSSATITESLSDSAAATDTATDAAALVESLSDSAAATDTATGDVGAQTYNESIADSAAATDELSSVADLSVSLSDSAAATDEVFAGAQEYTESLSDSAAVADDWTRAVSVTEMLSDAAVVSDVLGSTAILSVLCEELAAGSDIVVVEGGIPVPTEIYARLVSGDVRRQRATRTNVQMARRTNVQMARRGN